MKGGYIMSVMLIYKKEYIKAAVKISGDLTRFFIINLCMIWKRRKRDLKKLKSSISILILPIFGILPKHTKVIFIRTTAAHIVNYYRYSKRG